MRDGFFATWLWGKLVERAAKRWEELQDGNKCRHVVLALTPHRSSCGAKDDVHDSIGFDNYARKRRQNLQHVSM